MNIKITLAPIIKYDSLLKKNKYYPPLDCKAGDKMILFLKKKTDSLNLAGVVVADIISRLWNSGSQKFDYNVYVADGLINPEAGTLTQCDIEFQCCYDCSARYFDALGIQSPLCANIYEYGAVGDGIADDTEALTDAIATGCDVYIPKGIFNITLEAVLELATANQKIYGEGWQSILSVKSTGLGLFKLAASGIQISSLQIWGSETTESVSTYAIDSDVNETSNVVISNVYFSGEDATKGFNSAIRLNTGADNSKILFCRFDRLVGENAGYGYGVLTGECDGVIVEGCHFKGTDGRGRHAVYFSAGSRFCKATKNYIDGFNREGLTTNSTGVQPYTEAINFSENTLINTPAVINAFGAGDEFGSIGFYGKTKNVLIANNQIYSSGCRGIVADKNNEDIATGVTIKGNHIFEAQYEGIYISGIDGVILDSNFAIECSQVAAGTYSNILITRDLSDNAGSENIVVGGNISLGPNFARSPIRFDNTTPPTKVKMFNNIFPEANFAGIELNGIVAIIDGTIRAQHGFDVPNIANNASYSQGFAVPGAVPGDNCIATVNTTNMDGCSIYCYCNVADAVTVVVTNNSGGAKDIVSSSIFIDVFKRDF